MININSNGKKTEKATNAKLVKTTVVSHPQMGDLVDEIYPNPRSATNLSGDVPKQEKSQQQSTSNPSHNNGAWNIVTNAIAIFVLLSVGGMLMVMDGWCAGGSFCRGAPGVLSFIGSLVIAIGISWVFYTPRHKRVSAVLILFFAVVVYLIHLGIYYYLSG